MSTGTRTAGSAEWTRRAERGSLAALRAMVWLSLRLGRRLTRPIVYLIAAYFLVAAPAARQASRDYLRRLSGRSPGWAALYRHIFTFAAVLHDRVFLLNNRASDFDISVHGADALLQCAREGRGMLMLGAHVGSFDALRGTARFNSSLKTCMAMYEGNAQKVMGVLGAINPDAAQEIVPLGQIDSMIRLHEHLQAGRLVGILADRSFGAERLTEVTFLDAPAWLPQGPFRMAALLGAPVFFMVGLYHGGKRYSVHFEPLPDLAGLRGEARQAAVEACIRRYVALLEQHCRSAPYNWFNFFDFWKTPDAPARHAPSGDA